jgi:hypothetical protein
MIASIPGRVYLTSLDKEFEAVINIESDEKERVVTTYHVINPDSECPDDLNPDINDKYLFELSVYKQDDRLLLKRWKCLPLGTWEAFNAKNPSTLKVVLPSSLREISTGQDRRKIFDSEGNPKNNHEIPGFRSDGAQLITEDSLNRGLKGKFYAPPTKNWQVLQGYEREDFARNNGRKCYVLSPTELLLQPMIDKPMTPPELFERIRKAEKEIAQKKLDKKDVQDLDMEIAAGAEVKKEESIDSKFSVEKDKKKEPEVETKKLPPLKQESISKPQETPNTNLQQTDQNQENSNAALKEGCCFVSLFCGWIRSLSSTVTGFFTSFYSCFCSTKEENV